MPRRFNIGREKTCDIPIADDSVSRLHAEIWLADDGAIMMADRGSSNGTTLVRGGQSFPLRQDVVLPGDHVRFGGVLLSVAEIVAAVQAKNPGALTPPSAAPPPPPHLPPPPPRGAGPPAPIASNSTGVLLRCECGAIKTLGQVCPGCRR